MPSATKPLASHTRMSAAAGGQVQVLLEEYRQLYELVRFRLAALDQRVPLAGVALVAALAGIGSLTVPMQVVFLVAIPLSLLWWLTMTATHARSFEDALRRIEEIEQRVNRLCGEELLVFQSSHPGRGQVGGRTGQQTVQAVLTASAIVLGACGILADGVIGNSHWLIVFDALLAVIGAALLAHTSRLQRYAYKGTENA